MKCIYWYADDYTVQMASEGNDIMIVTFVLKLEETKKDFIESFIKKFNQDLIDAALQDVINKETKTIRELLIAKAFAGFKPEK